jgi:hypothetical protein
MRSRFHLTKCWQLPQLFATMSLYLLYLHPEFQPPLFFRRAYIQPRSLLRFLRLLADPTPEQVELF